MINNHTLARPYARAAFEFAKNANQVDTWFSMLKAAAYVLEQPTVVLELGKPTLTHAQKANFLANLLAGNVDDSFSNFLYVLGDNGRLSLLPTLCELFEDYKLEAERIVDVEVETAFTLSEEQLQKITNALSKRLDRTVQAKQTVNSALIAGLMIRAGDLVIDSSVRGRLDKLAEAMNS